MIITKEEAKYLLNYEKNLTQEQLENVLINIKNDNMPNYYVIDSIPRLIMKINGNYEIDDFTGYKYLENYKLNKLLSETLPTNKKEKRIKL